MKKKILLGGAAVVVIAVVVVVFFVRGGNHKYEFRFDKVSRGDLTVYVTATGTISAVTTVDVGTQVSGIVQKLYADFNSVVKEGQVIAQIDPTFLQQSVKDAEANLSRANAQYADAKRTYERTKSLFDKQLESQANYDAALTQMESNSAALKQAQATLDRAKINLAYATIYAPISGVVINRAVNVGQTVAASFSSPTLFTIANDLSKMQVQTTVDESDIGRISIGQEASFTVDAYSDEKFTGTVSQIRLAPVSIQNVVNYTVIIDVDNDQLKLMPGMTANVKILAASGKDVLRVSNMALRLQPPPEVVDSAKVQAMREGFMARAEGGGMSDSAQRMASGGAGEGVRGGDPPQEHSSGERGEERRGAGGMPGGREYFTKLRDSIQAAHGGTLSREELRNEIASVMARRSPERAKAAPVPVRRNVGSTKFGITIRYPEFQKSSYVPSRTSGRARIWVLNSAGKLEPIMVTTGMTDGRYTEITTDQLKPGDQIVLGVTSNDAAGDQARSPLTQQGQRMGGPGFR
jgi:HlyD family secretion protein